MSADTAVLLLSGGLDSTTVLAHATDRNYRVHAMSFDYGQKNRFETQRAAAIARQYQVVEHRIVTIDLRVFGGSSLTSDAPVERDRPLDEIGTGIPSTYVPARNTLFLSYALCWAEALGAHNIFIGVNEVDTSGYPDCRPAFIEAFTQMANTGTRIGTESGVTIHTPLQRLRKAAIIRMGLALGVDYGMTNSCYHPDQAGRACGRCDACRLRLNAFEEVGIADPVPYQSSPAA
ncbi:MAG: 7-cyano-7-deazaguanine synthase QueC [Bdellovibrionales bacterium]|nr:7-cyano-7-deazaguanine synthase QueC [Bdellovibrionales bacterium]